MIRRNRDRCRVSGRYTGLSRSINRSSPVTPARCIDPARCITRIAVATLAVVTLGGIGCSRFENSASQTGGQQAPTVQVGPKVPEYSIWRPFFATTLGNHTPSEIVGTAFAVAADDDAPPRLVTSLRLIGPETGLAKADSPAAARAAITELWLTDTFGATDNTLRAGEPVELAMPHEPTSSGESPEGADSSAEEEKSVELVARELIVATGGPAEKRLRPLRLADRPALKGDTVWMVTAVFGGASPSQRCHRATITSVGDEGYLEYEFENERLSLHAATGAPLLNDDGLVVGVHLHDSSKDGTIAGRGLVAAPVKEAMERLRGRE